MLMPPGPIRRGISRATHTAAVKLIASEILMWHLMPSPTFRARRTTAMILQMPRSFTDHPLSRKVEHLKSYAKILYML